MEHSSIGGSSAEQFINCPASVRMQEIANIHESSVWADDGTAAHFVGEHCLIFGKNTDKLKPKDFPQHKDLLSYETFEHVQKYINAVREKMTPDSHQEFEKEIDLEWLYPNSKRKMFGTVDAAVGEDFGTLHITDLKYGEWILVDVVNNSQLMYYALGAIGENNPHDYSDVVLTIVQPRMYHPDSIVRSWKISIDDLYKWGYEVLKPAIIRTEEDNAPFCMGKWCRFCDLLSENGTKAGVCPAIGEKIMALTNTNINSDISDFPDVEKQDGKTMSELLQYTTIFNKWIKSVKGVATMKAEAGEKIEGHKLVAQKSLRQWIDEKMATKILNSSNIEGPIFTPLKLRSPAQIEALVKRNKHLDIKEIAKLWKKPDKGYTLVPESDPRKEVDMSCDFEKIEEEELW